MTRENPGDATPRGPENDGISATPQDSAPNSFVQSAELSDREAKLRRTAERYREHVGEILYRRSRVAQALHEMDCEDAPLTLFTDDGGWTTGCRCTRCPFEFTWDNGDWPDLVRLGYIERDEFARYLAEINFPQALAEVDEIHASWYPEAIAA